MENRDTGLLLNEHNIKLHRQWFKQMCKLIGINVQYRAPTGSSKTYNIYSELDAHYTEPETVSCIFDEHPSQKTMRMLGWNAELNETIIVIHVPYDLPQLQAGCLFIIPSGLDQAEPRIFRVIRMSNIAIYPASIACEIAPVYFNDDVPSNITDFTQSTFNVLDDESEEYHH